MRNHSVDGRIRHNCGPLQSGADLSAHWRAHGAKECRQRGNIAGTLTRPVRCGTLRRPASACVSRACDHGSLGVVVRDDRPGSLTLLLLLMLWLLLLLLLLMLLLPLLFLLLPPLLPEQFQLLQSPANLGVAAAGGAAAAAATPRRNAAATCNGVVAVACAAIG